MDLSEVRTICDDIPKVPESALQDLKNAELDVVHDKIDRQRAVDESNHAQTETFSREYADRSKRVGALVGMHVQTQSYFCSELRAKVDKDLEKKSEEKTAVSSTYTDTVTQLVEVLNLKHHCYEVFI